MKLTSFKEIIEQTISKAFESEMDQAIDKYMDQAIENINTKREELKREAKKQANSIALEMLHKADVNSISLELKL